MNDGDSDKTIQHNSNDKTMGHDSAPPPQPPRDDKSSSPDSDSNRTQAGDATLMFSSGGEKANDGAASPGGTKRAIPDVANYEILGELGRGGMGVVYKARNRELNRIVALKMILSGVHASEETIQRFRTEAEAVAQLQHPNIVQVFDVGQCDGQPWCALEFVDGGGLDQILEARELDEREAAHLVEQLARAMQSAHVAGIVHRDLKPANILIGKSSESSTNVKSVDGLFPKITDFGLAKRVEQNASHTQTGAIVGTPSYMSPEQARGLSRIGPSADIYALGAILYRLLTGRPPFAAETPIKTVMQVISAEPVAPQAIRPNVDRDLATICMKCLEKDPARRYPSAEHLAQDLARFSSGEPILARPVSTIERTGKWIRRKPWAAAVIALTGLGLLGTIIGGAMFNARLSSAYNEVQIEQQKAVRALEAGNVARKAAVAAGELAEKNANESQRRLIDNYVNNGLKALEQNQPLYALPWFAEAIHIDQDPARSRMHVMRFEAARERCPQVLDTWLTDSAVSHVRLNRQGTRAIAATGTRKVILRDVVNQTMISEFEVEGQVIFLHADEDLETLLTVVVRLDEAAADYQHQVFDICFRNASTFEKSGIGIVIPFDANSRQSDNALSFPAHLLAKVVEEDSSGLRIHDLLSGEVIAEPKAHGQIRFVEFNPTGTQLMVLSDRIQLWDVASREWAWESEFDSQGIEPSSIGLGNQVLVAKHDWTRIVDLATGEQLSEFGLAEAPISVSVSPDGSRIFLAYPGGRVEIRDPTGQLVHTLNLSAQATEFVFRQACGVMLIATNDQVIRVDILTGQQMDAPIPATVLPLNSLNLDVSGTRIVTGGGHGILGGQGIMRVWSSEPAITTFPVSASDEAVDGERQSAALSSDGTMLASFSNRRSEVDVFRIREGSAKSEQVDPPTIKQWLESPGFTPIGSSKNSSVVTAVFSPDSGSLLVCHENGDAEIRSIPSGDVVSRFQPGKPILAATFSLDGQFVAVATGQINSSVGVFSVSDGVQQGVAFECPRRVFDIAFTPDDQAIVAVSRDLSIRCWDLKTSEMRWQRLVGLLANDVSIDVPRDTMAICGGRLGGLPGRILVTRLSTGEGLVPPIDLNSEVMQVDISASNDLMLVTLANGTVEVRSLNDGEPVSPAISHPDQVLDASLRDNGELLLTVCRDQQVRVFDRLTGLLISSWDFQGNDATSARFVDDKPLIVVGGNIATLCALPGSTLGRDEAVDSSIFISATSISDQGLVRHVSGSRLADVAGSGPGIASVQPSTIPSTTNDSTAALAFYKMLEPEMQTKFPGLLVPEDPKKPLLLEFKFNAGEIRRYKVDSVNDMNTMGVVSQQNQQDWMTCKCEEVVENRFRVTVEYENALSEMDTPGGSYRIDMANPNRDRAAPAFRPLVEIMKATYAARSVYEVEFSGVIPKYSSPPELVEAIEGNSQAQSMSISPESLSANFVSMWMNFPDHPVVVSDQWPAIIVVSAFKQEDINATATFLGVVNVEGRKMGVIRVRADASGRPYEAEMFGVMTSRSDSIMYFDLEAGCIERAFTSSVAKMDLTINNTSLEQLIDGRLEIRRLKD